METDVLEDTLGRKKKKHKQKTLKSMLKIVSQKPSSLSLGLGSPGLKSTKQPG